MHGLYLDSCCIIYLYEGARPFQAAVANRLLSYRDTPDARLITSRLSRLECRTRPLKESDQPLLSRYDAFFSSDRLVLGDISAAVIEQATGLRARYGIKTPDAIHLATAIEHGAALFLTGDQALARCTDIQVEVLTC